MATVAQDLQKIREATYGEEVREAIADGIEHCYTDCYRITASQISGDDYRMVCGPISS